MAISIEDIKKLKELTGVGLTDAKQALVEADEILAGHPSERFVGDGFVRRQRRSGQGGGDKDAKNALVGVHD